MNWTAAMNKQACTRVVGGSFGMDSDPARNRLKAFSHRLMMY